MWKRPDNTNTRKQVFLFRDEKIKNKNIVYKKQIVEKNKKF